MEVGSTSQIGSVGLIFASEHCGRGEYPKKVVRSSGPVYRGFGRQICRQLPVRKASTREVRQRWPTKVADKVSPFLPPGGFQAVTSRNKRNKPHEHWVL